jgi:SHS2 domain-containing protein
MREGKRYGKGYWEHFPHGADVGIRGRGSTLGAAFEQVAIAMTAAITDPELVKPNERVAVSCDAPDAELLLVEWLNALVFEMATRRLLFSDFSVMIEGSHLTGEARGEAIDVQRHQPAAEVKGATFTALRVAREPSGLWMAQCVVDV